MNFLARLRSLFYPVQYHKVSLCLVQWQTILAGGGAFSTTLEREFLNYADKISSRRFCTWVHTSSREWDTLRPACSVLQWNSTPRVLAIRTTQFYLFLIKQFSFSIAFVMSDSALCKLGTPNQGQALNLSRPVEMRPLLKGSHKPTQDPILKKQIPNEIYGLCLTVDAFLDVPSILYVPKF